MSFSQFCHNTSMFFPATIRVQQLQKKKIIWPIKYKEMFSKNKRKASKKCSLYTKWRGVGGLQEAHRKMELKHFGIEILKSINTEISWKVNIIEKQCLSFNFLVLEQKSLTPVFHVPFETHIGTDPTLSPSSATLELQGSFHPGS